MRKIVLLLSFVLANSIFAQQYNGFAHEIFFGRIPSAKLEAMGRIVTLNFDPYFVSQSNPANLVSTKGIAIFYANSSPFYLLNEATYNYAGVSYNNPTIGAFAFNIMSFNYGITFNQTGENDPTVIGTFKPTREMYTLTYSNQIPDWFSFGINANLFSDNIAGSETFNSTFFELGLSKKVSFECESAIKHDVVFAAQIKNIFNQSHSTIDQAQADLFPSIFRIGVSNLFEYTDADVFEKAYLFGFTIGFEYQDLLNSGKRTAYKVGGELSFIDIIFLRSGYYSVTPTISEDELTDFTYGLGLKLDFEKYISDNFPLTILIDFVSLQQPSSVSVPINFDNFTTFNFIANYRLE